MEQIEAYDVEQVVSVVKSRRKAVPVDHGAPD